MAWSGMAHLLPHGHYLQELGAPPTSGPIDVATTRRIGDTHPAHPELRHVAGTDLTSHVTCPGSSQVIHGTTYHRRMLLVASGIIGP